MKSHTSSLSKDFFISYAPSDLRWAVWLGWQLEAAGCTVTLAAWHFPPGSNAVLERHWALRTQRTLLVLSPNALNCDLIAADWAAAFRKDPTGRNRWLIPVRVLPCKPEGLLSSLVYIDLVGKNEASARQTLLEYVENELRPSTKPIFPNLTSTNAPPPYPPVIEPYRQWLRVVHGRVHMMGVKAADWSWELDRVYVPLKFSRDFEVSLGGRRRKVEHERQDIPIEDIFKRLDDDQDVLIVGDAGTGKTTVLKKLLHTILHKGPEAVGLSQGTIPIFLRLAGLKRYFQEKYPLWALFWNTVSPAQIGLPLDTAKAVWNQPYILLILDGLDELADSRDRLKALKIIEAMLQVQSRMRAVVSCRRSARGYELTFPSRFVRFSMRLLSDLQRQQLAIAWFSEAFKELGRPHPKVLAKIEADKLLQKVGMVAYLERHHRELVSTPLFATLLCVIHLTKAESLPTDSVSFMQSALELLLDRRELEGLEEKPLKTYQLIELLEEFAFRTQKEGRQNGLTVEEWTEWVGAELRFRQLVDASEIELWQDWLGRHLCTDTCAGAIDQAMVRWFHQDANILAELGTEVLTFAHRGFQEFLTARRLKALGESGLCVLAKNVNTDTWRETFLYWVRMTEEEQFRELIRQLLKRPDWVTLKPVLEEVLAEHETLTSAPFLETLQFGLPPMQCVVLELFQHRVDDDLLGVAANLVHAKDTRVRTMAHAIVTKRAQQDGRSAIPGQTFLEPITGIRFLWVPGGTFMMGSEEGENDERPVHRVTIDPLWLAETPVTNRQYGLYVKASRREPGYWRNSDRNQPEQPVVGVSWDDANAFCAWLADASQLKVRLPKEAEWEFCARSREGRRYPWGDTEPNEHLAWYNQDAGATAKPVGYYPDASGPFGHLDLAGNIWEWCCDGYDGRAYKRSEHKRGYNPEVATRNQQYVLRGGSFVSDADWLRSSYRDRADAWYRDCYLGFRPCIGMGSSIEVQTPRPRAAGKFLP